MDLGLHARRSTGQLKLRDQRKGCLPVVEERLAGARGKLGELRLAGQELLDELGNADVEEKD